MQIGAYRVIRQLGSGGMGDVYLVQHPRLPRYDALKLLDATFSRNEQFRNRFDREADFLARLHHPNIITVFDRGEHEGRFWLTMEYVDGMDSAAFTRSVGGALRLDMATDIIAGAGAALDYAYFEHGVTHRDVKPANILLGLNPEGRLMSVKLADFGIAKAAGEATSLTSTGVTMGTMTYIAPEAVEGRPVDNRADIYSLGVTAFVLLSGRPPFTGDTLPSLMMAHVNHPVPSISQTNPNLPIALDAVFSRVLAKDPAHRYASCAEFVGALRAVMAMGSSLSAPTVVPPAHFMSVPPPPAAGNVGYHAAPPGPHPSTGYRPRRRGRALLTMAAIIAVIAVVVSAVTIVAPWKGSTDAGGPSTPGTAASALDLDRVPLGATEINRIMGRDDMLLVYRGDAKSKSTEGPNSEVVPDECRNVGGIATSESDGTGIRQARVTGTYTAATKFTTGVLQGVFEHESEAKARELLARLTPIWRQCSEKTVTRKQEATTFTVRFSDLTVRDDRLLVTEQVQETAADYSCKLGMTRKFAFVFLVKACGNGLRDQSSTVLDELAAKVTSATPALPAPALPDVGPVLLTAAQLNESIGRPMRDGESRDRLDLDTPETRASVPACTSLAAPHQAATYSAYGWQIAASRFSKAASDDPLQTTSVTQSIVLASSPQVATQFLDEATRNWKSCLGQTYKEGTESSIVTNVDTPVAYMVTSRGAFSDLPILRKWRSLAIRGSYIVEIAVWGTLDTDMRAITEKLLAKLPA